MSYFDSIYADTLLPPRAVSVYMYLKDRSNSAGSCWPGIKTIARDMFKAFTAVLEPNFFVRPIVFNSIKNAPFSIGSNKNTLHVFSWRV